MKLINNSDISFPDRNILCYELLEDSFSEKPYCTPWVQNANHHLQWKKEINLKSRFSEKDPKEERQMDKWGGGGEIKGWSEMRRDRNENKKGCKMEAHFISSNFLVSWWSNGRFQHRWEDLSKGSGDIRWLSICSQTRGLSTSQLTPLSPTGGPWSAPAKFVSLLTNTPTHHNKKLAWKMT